MRWFLSFLFMTNAAWAQHEQTAKPVKASELIEAIQFHLKDYLDQIRKKAVGVSIIGPSRLLFERTHYTCGGKEPLGAGAVLYIVRDSQQQKLTERLILETCGTQMEILSLERRGPAVIPSTDANFLKGILPPFIDGETYHLTILDRRQRFEIVKTKERTKMFWGVVERNTGYADVQMTFDEAYSDNILNRQSVSLLIYTGTQVREEHTTEFIWNIEPRFKTARQYLYYRGNEVPPHVFVQIIADIYGWLFSFLKSEFTYSAF